MSPNTAPRPLAVLIVDDDPDTGDTLAELLALYGHTVRVARGGGDALRQAAADPPDVVLLDLVMPAPDGYAVAHTLRERSGTAKRPLLIALTGCASAADHARTAAAGFDLHLDKPVEPAVLVGVLRRFGEFLSSARPLADNHPPPEDPPDPAVAGKFRRRTGPPFVAPTTRLDVLPFRRTLRRGHW